MYRTRFLYLLLAAGFSLSAVSCSSVKDSRSISASAPDWFSSKTLVEDAHLLISGKSNPVSSAQEAQREASLMVNDEFHRILEVFLKARVKAITEKELEDAVDYFGPDKRLRNVMNTNIWDLESFEIANTKQFRAEDSITLYMRAVVSVDEIVRIIESEYGSELESKFWKEDALDNI